MSDDVRPALFALGDQIQQACNNSRLQVVGFVVLVAGADGAIITETRSRIDQFDAILQEYIDAPHADRGT
jgi:hypothetical protein